MSVRWPPLLLPLIGGESTNGVLQRHVYLAQSISNLLIHSKTLYARWSLTRSGCPCAGLCAHSSSGSSKMHIRASCPCSSAPDERQYLILPTFAFSWSHHGRGNINALFHCKSLSIRRILVRLSKQPHPSKQTPHCNEEAKPNLPSHACLLRHPQHPTHGPFQFHSCAIKALVHLVRKSG